VTTVYELTESTLAFAVVVIAAGERRHADGRRRRRIVGTSTAATRQVREDAHRCAVLACRARHHHRRLRHHGRLPLPGARGAGRGPREGAHQEVQGGQGAGVGAAGDAAQRQRNRP